MLTARGFNGFLQLDLQHFSIGQFVYRKVYWMKLAMVLEILHEGISVEEEKEGYPVQNDRDHHVYVYRELDKIKIDEEYCLNKGTNHDIKFGFPSTRR